MVLFIVVYTTRRVDCILFVLLALDIILAITNTTVVANYDEQAVLVGGVRNTI